MRKKTRYRVRYEEIREQNGKIIRIPCTCIVEGRQELKEFVQGIFESPALAYRGAQHQVEDAWLPYSII